MTKFKEWAVEFFTLKERSGKRRPNVTRLFVVGAGIIFVGALSSQLGSRQDTSVLVYTGQRPPPKRKDKIPEKKSSPRPGITSAFKRRESERMRERKVLRKKKTPTAPLKYNKGQILSGTKAGRIPTGTAVRGVLTSSLDTREQGLVRAMLPGGTHFGGKLGLPRKTAVFGTFSYSGRGKKVSVSFNVAVLPDGRERPIRVKATLEGKYHSNRAGKTAMALGLSMAAGMGEVMAQKEVLGDYTTLSVKPAFKNALYHGAGQALGAEAERQEKEIGKLPPYVTVEVGTAFKGFFAAPLEKETLER